MQALFFTLILSTPNAGAETSEAIARAAVYALTYPSSRRAGTPYQVRHCRRAPKGCRVRIRAFARYFVEAGKKHDIDPWLLAAMAARESGFNPYARGPSDELGILQIHPRNPAAKLSRWHRDSRWRKRCRRIVGACQREVVMLAGRILAQAIKACGSVERGLGAYNAGRCSAELPYVRRVLRTRDQLRSLAGGPPA